MATITKRTLAGNLAVYRVRIRKRGVPGQSKTFLKHADATAWAAAVEGDIARGVFRNQNLAEHTTIREGLYRYLDEITPNKRSSLAESYLINSLIKTELADYTFASLRAADLAKWRDKRLTEVSPGTVLKGLILVSHLYKVARCDWGMEGLISPVDSVRKPKPAKGRSRRLQPGEEEELLLRARKYGEPIPTIITLALETAMRRGEIAGLRWEHVDFRRRIIHLSMTKNGEPRDVPLSSRALEILQRFPRRIDGWVFGIRADGITQAFERITGTTSKKKQSKGRRKDKPLENLRFHDLRHEAISRLFEKGLNPMQVATIDGHKTLAMLKRYTHLRAEDLVAMLG